MDNKNKKKQYLEISNLIKKKVRSAKNKRKKDSKRKYQYNAS